LYEIKIRIKTVLLVIQMSEVTVVCKNRLESEFESLIAKYIYINMTITIDSIPHNPEVTIENIIEFYIQNVKEIDIEGLIRAFITAIHFATDTKSAKLSRWFIDIRPDLINYINPDMMVTICSKKLSNLLGVSDLQFITDYIRWLLTTYCEKCTQQEKHYVLTKYIYHINRKLMIMDGKNNQNISDRDIQLASYVSDNYIFIFELYAKN